MNSSLQRGSLLADLNAKVGFLYDTKNGSSLCQAIMITPKIENILSWTCTHN